MIIADTKQLFNLQKKQHALSNTNNILDDNCRYKTV
jgi:hypothetical protein